MTNTIVKNVKDGSVSRNTNQNMMGTASGAASRNRVRTAEATSLQMAMRWINRSERNKEFSDTISRINFIKEGELAKLDFIINTIAKASGIDRTEIAGTSRRQRVASCRQLYCYLAEKTKNSLQEIGDVCQMDHSTVIHNNKVIMNILTNNFKDDKSIYVKEILDRYDKIVSGNIN